jgi:hypothetical protein
MGHGSSRTTPCRRLRVRDSGGSAHQAAIERTAGMVLSPKSAACVMSRQRPRWLPGCTRRGLQPRHGRGLRRVPVAMTRSLQRDSRWPVDCGCPARCAASLALIGISAIKTSALYARDAAVRKPAATVDALRPSRWRGRRGAVPGPAQRGGSPARYSAERAATLGSASRRSARQCSARRWRTMRG